MIKIKKKVICISIAILAMLSVFALGFTDSLQASKATAKTSSLTLIDWTATKDTTNGSVKVQGPWKTVLSTSIKTSQQKDLFLDASFESALYTDTLVKSKDMVSDTSNATAGIKVRVLVDGKEASPGQIIFARRSQTLSATLQGQLDLVTNPDGTVSLETVAPEQISLLLDTINANSFNFVLENVGTGVHTIEVQAAIDLGASAQAGSATAKAMVGKGSLTVEEVRMIRDAVVEI